MQSKIPGLAALVLHASEKKNGLSMLQRHVPKLLASAAARHYLSSSMA
jgi:hypothetical protein